jgi:DNA-3-methyladenine glycosylase
VVFLWLLRREAGDVPGTSAVPGDDLELSLCIEHATSRGAVTIRIKRVYETPEDEDGYRVLVDRLWPRGLTKAAARVDLWLLDIAPSDELRRWFHHDVANWDEFRSRYLAELADHEDLVDKLLETEAAYETTTLVYGAKDEQHNQAVVLLEALEGRRPRREKTS